MVFVHQDVNYPIESTFKTNELLWEWASKTEEGIQAQKQVKVGFINKKLKFIRLTALSNCKKNDTIQTMLDEYNKWEIVIDEFKNNASD